MPMLGRDPKPSDPEQSEPLHKKDQPDHLIDPALRVPQPIEQEKTTPVVQSPDADQKSMRQPLHMSSPHHRTYSNRPPSPPPPIATMSNSPSPSLSVDRSSNSTPHIRRSPPNMQPMYPPPSYDQRHHYSQRGDPIAHAPYSYPPHQPFEQQQQQRYDHHHPQHAHSQHPDPHSQYHTPYFSVPTMAHPPPPPPPQMRDNYGRQYPPISQTPVTIVHTDDAATKLTDGIRRRCFNCCTTDTSTWRRSNLSPGKVLCNKCGLFERTHSRPRPDQFPHKRGPLAVSVSRGRTPPGNQLPPISNQSGSYQYHHTQLTPLNAGEYHSNPLPTWQSNSSTGSNPNNGTSGQVHNGSANNHTVSPTESTNVSGNGISGGGGGNGNGGSGGGGSSANMGPLLMPRRPTLDSPRMSANSTPRGGRPFVDEPLSSNTAAISSNASGSAAVISAGGGDSSRPHSQPATPPSRSSTVHPSVKSHDGGGSSAGHSPPPASNITSAGSSARDQA